jgi:hypothetical protein
MLISGTKEKLLISETVSESCMHCGKNNVINLAIYQKYFHLFFIPFIPLKKTAISTCSHCKEKLFLKEMTISLKENFERIRGYTKTAWWTFIGSIILVGLITNELINDKKKNNRSAILINSPQKDDFYEIKTDDELYTLYKVEYVTKDSVFFKFSKNEYLNSLSLIEAEAQNESNFTKKIYGIARNELKLMLKKEKLLDIDRE